jgi:hypothetical protein
MEGLPHAMGGRVLTRPLRRRPQQGPPARSRACKKPIVATSTGLTCECEHGVGSAFGAHGGPLRKRTANSVAVYNKPRTRPARRRRTHASALAPAGLGHAGCALGRERVVVQQACVCVWRRRVGRVTGVLPFEVWCSGVGGGVFVAFLSTRLPTHACAAGDPARSKRAKLYAPATGLVRGVAPTTAAPRCVWVHKALVGDAKYKTRALDEGLGPMNRTRQCGGRLHSEQAP